MNTTLITQPIVDKIRQIVRCFETDKTNGASYGAIALLGDGPGGCTQVTYGESQTTEFGNLSVLIGMYIDEKGVYATPLREYRNRIGRRPSLCTDQGFLNLLKLAGSDPVMKVVQNRFFNTYYFNPAKSFFNELGFTLPLSLLVIYDSHIQSGGILDFLRKRFPEVPPVRGGDEKAWINAYVQVRDAWLETHSNKAIAGSDYRTDSFIYNIKKNNWMLDQPFLVVNYKDQAEKTEPIIKHVV